MSDLPEWRRVDSALRQLATEQCSRDHEIGALLLRAERAEPWKEYGYRSLYEYAERLFGWGYRATCERLRVAKALQDLPGFAEELKKGRMTYGAVREATRVATPETEIDWIAALRGMTARAVEAKVARHERGGRPSDPGDPSRVKQVVRLAFTPMQWALVGPRIEEMRKGDASLTDEECFTLLAQMACKAEDEAHGEAPAPAAPRPPVRIEMHVEPDGTVTVEGVAGERLEVPPAAAECALCDAEVWKHETGGRLLPVKRTAIPAATERLLQSLAKGRCEVCRVRIEPHCHHIDLVSEGGSNDIANLILLCSAHHSRAHFGTLLIEGARESGWIFRHADGSVYGGMGDAAPDPAAVGAHADAFLALKALGYREGEIRTVLAELRTSDPGLSTAEKLITAALRRFRVRKYGLDPEPRHFVREAETPYGTSHVEIENRGWMEGAAAAGARRRARATGPGRRPIPTWRSRARVPARRVQSNSHVGIRAGARRTRSAAAGRTRGAYKRRAPL